MSTSRSIHGAGPSSRRRVPLRPRSSQTSTSRVPRPTATDPTPPSPRLPRPVQISNEEIDEDYEYYHLNGILYPIIHNNPNSPPYPFTFRILSTFLAKNLLLLFPSHFKYPKPDTICAICHEAFHGAHAPVLIVGVPGCTGHMFGYQCLRNCIAGKMPNSNKCPLCRTVWFDMGEEALRGLGEVWESVDAMEGWLLGRKTRAEQFKLLEEARIEMGDGGKRGPCAQVFIYTGTVVSSALILGVLYLGACGFFWVVKRLASYCYAGLGY